LLDLLLHDRSALRVWYMAGQRGSRWRGCNGCLEKVMRRVKRCIRHVWDHQVVVVCVCFETAPRAYVFGRDGPSAKPMHRVKLKCNRGVQGHARIRCGDSIGAYLDEDSSHCASQHTAAGIEGAALWVAGHDAGSLLSTPCAAPQHQGYTSVASLPRHMSLCRIWSLVHHATHRCWMRPFQTRSPLVRKLLGISFRFTKTGAAARECAKVKPTPISHVP
jgi:hypothetical protein